MLEGLEQINHTGKLSHLSEQQIKQYGKTFTLVVLGPLSPGTHLDHKELTEAVKKNKKNLSHPINFCLNNK